MTSGLMDTFFYWSGVMFWACGVFAWVSGTILIYLEKGKP